MKKDNKFKITMPQLQEIIKEEYASMKADATKAKKIKEKISKINEELKTLPNIVSEVEASGTKKVKSTGWTGQGQGDIKYGEKFEKIGSHLKEDDEIDGEIEIGGEENIEIPEIPEMEGGETGYFETKLSELGKELDAKLGGEEMPEETEIEVVGDEGDEIESILDTEENEEDVEKDEDEEEIDEIDETKVVSESEIKEESEVVAEVVEEKEETIDEMEETKIEAIEGESTAQKSDARFNDNMTKDDHVNESKKKTGTTLLSEGYSPEKKSKMDAELERMKKLAKI